MYKEINDKFYFSLCINNQLYTLPELESYIRKKVKVKRIKHKTLITKLSTIKNFIIWTLANPVIEDEDLILYLARYLEVSENGFIIYDTIFIEELNENIEYPLIESLHKKSSTIDKDKAIIEDFLKTTNQSLFDTFDLRKNIKSLKHSNKNSKHDGYGLRMGTLAQNAFVNDESIIPSRKHSIAGDIRAFPYELFNELLQLANPREKLIYLLCGACSARSGQVLNLTQYDFDYLNKNIWLIDPRNNEQLGIQGIGRKQFLKDVYNIDASKDKPHVNVGFKAPIPLRYKERLPLYWISNIYKELFFEVLSEYKTIPESNRNPKHPFFFVTSSGNRLLPQQVDDTFKRHCKELKKRLPKYQVQLDQLGLHSLRHMFGVMMATFQAYLIMNGNPKNIPLDQIKIITKEAMGHKSISSTDIYFNRPWSLNMELGKFIMKIFTEMQNHQRYELLEKENNARFKKWK
jgi:integrase